MLFFEPVLLTAKGMATLKAYMTIIHCLLPNEMHREPQG